VLSHYYTDPLQPFHIAQSEAENNIHRAAEWSIAKAYDDLREEGEREFPTLYVDLTADPNWLVQLVCKGAERANAHYEKLIAHYDIQRGVVDPPAGLDRVARRIVAELIRYAAMSYAAVLARAIGESNVHPPEVALTGATLLAAAKMPVKLIMRRMADAQERRLVQRMYDELLATGTVEQHLPEDDRQVRDLHAQEVLAAREPQPQISKVFPFKPREPIVTRIDRQRIAHAPEQGASNVVAFATCSVQPRPLPASPAREPGADAASVALSAAEPSPPAPGGAPSPAEPASPSMQRPRAGLTERLEKVEVAAASPRFYLTLDHDVVDGPTIGPKTAERLYPHGIKTIRDLLKAEPAALAVLADARHITPEAIAEWQTQALLVCTVPGLRGTHAQLLVGAGYLSADAIAAADADKLCADVLAFAATTAGQRILRNGDPPDIEKIKGWLDAARSVKAA
jgi:hypothetical protein